jgi:vancomycin permeability regulator SanA
VTRVSDIQRIEAPADPIFHGDTPSRRRERPRRWVRRLVRLTLVLLVLALVVPRVTTWVLARGEIVHAPGDLPKLRDDQHLAAIVLGAGLKDNHPSPLLDDRIVAGARLFDKGRVDALIVSGDNSTKYYDEPTAMRQRALDLDVPATAIAADYAGRRTWDTCVRARKVFGLRKAVVVTSAFHVDRAVATCTAAGIDTVGYSVPDSRFDRRSRLKWRVRELPATTRALAEAWVTRPSPAVGGAPIDPFDACSIQNSLPPADAQRNAKLTGLNCPA